MRKFTIYWIEGGTSVIVGNSFSDAWRLSSVRYERRASYIDSFEVDGKFTKVAGQATCLCWFSPRHGVACGHDLALIGL